MTVPEKSRKRPVIRTPQEREEIIRIGMIILQTNPDISHRRLFIEVQDLVLEPSRHQDPGNFKGYCWVKDEALKRLNFPVIPSPTESIVAVPVPVVAAVDPVGAMDPPGETRAPSGPGGQLRGVRDLLVDLLDRVLSGYQEREDHSASLQKSLGSLQSSFSHFIERFESLQSKVSSITKDLYGPEDPVIKPADLEPVIDRELPVSRIPPEIQEEPPKKEIPKVKIGLIGMKKNQFDAVNRAVGDKAKLRMVETNKNFDNQTLGNCDWVLVSRWNGHPNWRKAQSLVGKDRVIRPHNHGVSSYIDLIENIVNTGSPN